jgi:hypothetical protein
MKPGRGATLVRWAGALLLFAAVPSASAMAAGHTYTVVQCDPLNRSHADAALEDASPYAARSFCGDPRNDHAIKVTSTGHAQHGSFGRVRWETGSPDLQIVGVDLRAKLRRDNGHVARLWTADQRLNEVARVAAGEAGATGYRRYRWTAGGRGARQFVASLTCERPAGCRQSNRAKTWVRDVRLKVADYSDPSFTTLDGTLLSRAWLRGSHDLRVQAGDTGSGIANLTMAINGARRELQRGNCDAIPGASSSARFQACSGELFGNYTPVTAGGPFEDGANTLSLCASDFAGNRTCSRHIVRVDNTAPNVRFAISQDPDDPELIRAAVRDPTSGVASGQILYRPMGDASWRHLATRLRAGGLTARVDSTTTPAGEYEFLAEATDATGNVARTTRRADGQPMVLSFPLKSTSRLSAHLAPGGTSRLTIRYGHSSKVTGQLRDAAGRPLAGEPITVTEHFGAGALIDRRVRTVRTDRDGLWGERLPAGPSRSVTATYAGTTRYLPDETSAGHVRVKTKATLRLSRHRVPEGRRVVFRGRVAHLAARIPAGGKLIELQVKDGSQWHTVRQAFYTGASGRYRMRYRFARFYRSNVSYRFRVKVLRELGWPYKAPVSSHAKRLVVKAR